MSQKNVAPRFVIDFVKKTITGTKASFKKAGSGTGEIYEELANKVTAHPDFTLIIKEQKKHGNKVKQTYEGLDFDLMEKYIAIQDNADMLAIEYCNARKMAKEIGTSVYPFVKKWFLNVFTDFDTKKAKTAISNHNVAQVANYETATPSTEAYIQKVA